ncbi:hypothetical protein BRC78_03955 [Halobacteriales archaeon QH_8_68_33]|nr:MAG: hypothetical protein BRC78_03955 [Halobacteriales archaeon QH_8_68_33]
MLRRPTFGIGLVLTFAAGAAALTGAGGPLATLGNDDGARGTCVGNETRPGFVPGRDLLSRADGFELTASDRTVRRGDRVTFALTNVDDDPRVTGTPDRYALQRRGTLGWRTVTLFRYTGFNASAFRHDPGSGFEWSFRATAAGFTDDRRVVCDRLRPGEYRFVFAGSSPLAARFEIRDGTPSGHNTSGSSAGESSR